ncbi:MAG TPA: zincin-like metallopeptidase domain-containing protein [Syntrophobacter fumaroxidans]|nr:zincin-like metallopeptidase domain-containing protein [Syntrophobacter fumaroxidans]
MQSKAYEHVTDRIIQSLKKGVVPWKKPWISLKPQNISGRAYTGINRLLLALNEYKYPIFLTMKQANDLGGRINKGEKSHLAVFWKIITVNAKNEDGEDTPKHIPYLRYYNVFNIEQTTLPLSVVKNADQIKSESECNGTESVQKAKELVASFRDVPSIEFNCEKACYIPALDRIMLPHRHLFQSDEGFYTTEFHEFIHSTGHPQRLNRKGIVELNFGSEEYSKEELIAEIGACFLCDLCGIAGNLDNSAAYIQGWMKALSDDPRMVVHAAGHAEKAVNFLTRQRETSGVLAAPRNGK